MNCILCAENYYKFPDGSLQNNCVDNSTLNSWKANIKENTNIIESSFNIFEESSFFQETTYISETDSTELESTLIIIEENEKSSGNNIFNESITSKDFKSQISNNITAFVNSSFLINGSDFLAVILNSDDLNPEEQLKLGISAIDLGNCTETIKDYYNISENDSLIILNMESKKNKSEKNENDDSFNLGKNIQVEIYDSLGNKLDLSVCKENIKIMKYIGDVEELDIE